MVRARSRATRREDEMALLDPARGAHAAHDLRPERRRQLLDLEGGVMAGGGIAGRLYRAEVSINFVGRQRLWYAISGVIVLISAIALAVKGLNFSLEFKGGSSFTFPSSSLTNQNAISRAITGAGGGDATIQDTSKGLLHQWTAQTGTLSNTVTQGVASAIEKAFHILPANMTIQEVGPTWGSQITSKAVEALI